MVPTSTAMLLLMAAAPTPGRLVCEPPPGAQYRFGGVVGERVDANLHHWLLPMPEANPGLTEMFRRRDRQPGPDLLPWSGEFVGKYLISAIQARRMVNSPELDATIRRVIAELATCQDTDGYLGPWPKAQRLLGQWDLWGHYHILAALLDWHQDTGDAAALALAQRIGDCVCGTYLDTAKRVSQAGSHEMNMAILTGLARLYRVTGEPRYLRMAREVEHDWEGAGDYLRQGLANVPFYRTPRPRWESLHDLQGLVELFRLTGEERYKTAFVNLWHSIRALDIHNTGGFTTGEQAVGDPYAQGAIETCCTVAWMAITADLLHLTGDAAAADELERALYNGGLGAQHPSGRWWTYNTPMDGVRKASAHDIVFQARPGTPELNCCSVNGPRVLGVLSEWAVLRDAEGLRVAYYGQGTADVALAGGTQVRLRQTTTYPVGDKVALVVEPATPTEFTLRLRVPGWCASVEVLVNGQSWRQAVPPTQPTEGREAAGQGLPHGPDWLPLRRRWAAGDTVELTFGQVPLVRAEAGLGACAGKVSLWRGPLLLAWDQRFNQLDEPDLPSLDATALDAIEKPTAPTGLRPWLLLEVGPADRRITLCDFASAGAAGNPYRSWLPGTHASPGRVCYLDPPSQAQVPPGRVILRWGPPGALQPAGLKHKVRVAEARSNRPVLEADTDAPYAVATLPVGEYTWQVFNGEAWQLPPSRFTVAAGAPPQTVQIPQPLALRADRALVDAPLAGDPQPVFGELGEAVNVVPAPDRHGHASGALAFNGRDSKLTYTFGYWPEGDYSAAAWFWLDAYADGRIAQVMSLWCRGGDDALRIVLDDRKLFARIEGIWSHPLAGAPVELHRWYHAAAVRQRGRLRLYLDGKLAGETECSDVGPISHATAVGVGCNPKYTGNECLPGRVAEFRLWARALAAEEVEAEVRR